MECLPSLGVKTYERASCIFNVIFYAAVEELRKPILKQGLKDTTAKKGEKAVLKAVITGDPVPDILWWKDGVQLLPEKDPNVIINCDTKFIQDDLKECTYTVTIPSARHKDTGQYSLKATNKFGSVESSVSVSHAGPRRDCEE